MTKPESSWSTDKIFWVFLAAHISIWTLVPSLINESLPIDVIEGLAWGNEGQWGYHKHPPLSPWLMDVFASMSASADWAQYLLAQVSVGIAFIAMWFLARNYVTPVKALISVLLLEGVYYYGYASPEFNANVVLLPVWALAMLAFYKSVKTGQLHWWVLLGIMAALGMLGKYFTAFLLLSMFGYLIFTRNGRRQFSHAGPYVTFVVMLAILLPHMLWMVDSNFITLGYGVARAGGTEDIGIGARLLYPVRFIGAQILLLLPPLLMLAAFGWKREASSKPSTEDRNVLLFLTFGPVLLVVLLSVVMGWKLRSMWGVPLFLTSGLALVYFIRPVINPARYGKFKAVFLFFALIGPIAYIAVYAARPALKDGGKRTQFPGEAAALQISTMWTEKFPNTPMPYIIGDVWRAGNIAYYWPETGSGKRAPSVFIDADPVISPWVVPQEIEKTGAIFVWYLPNAGKPQNIRQTYYQEMYPALQLMPPLQLAWDSWFTDNRLELGWAILAPKGTQ